MFVKITSLLFSVCVVAVLVVALSSISGAPCVDVLSINTGLNTANEVAKTAGTMYFLTDCTLIILVFLLIFSILRSIEKIRRNTRMIKVQSVKKYIVPAAFATSLAVSINTRLNTANEVAKTDATNNFLTN